MKKIIAILVAVSIISTFSFTALAAGNDTTQSNLNSNIAALKQKQQQLLQQRADLLAKRQQYLTKKEEFLAFRTALLEKRQQMLDNEKANTDLLKQNSDLRKDIANSLKAIKTSGAKLSDDTISKLKADNDQIKAILSDLKQTKGNIKDILEQNKGFIANKDYISMNSAFEQIYNVQQFRNEQLQKINGILQDMIKLMASEV